MPLKKQVLSLAFEKGLNQKASDRTLNLPFMADIKNGRMEKTGEIRRRNGLDPVTDGNAVNNVKKSLDNTATMVTTEFTKISNIAKRNEELVLLDDKNMFSLAGTDSGQYAEKGICDSVTMKNTIIRDDRGIVQSRPEIARIDGGLNGNWICAVWYEIDTTLHTNVAAGSRVSSYSVYAQMYNADSMAEVGQKQLVATTAFQTLSADFEDERAYLAPKPRVVATGTNFVIFYNKIYSTTNHLRYRIIDITSYFQLGSEKPSSSTSLLDVGKFACWDACAFDRTSLSDADGIAVFARLKTGDTSYILQEYKIDSSALSTSGMRTAYSIANSAEARGIHDYDINNPNPYAVFVRYHKPQSNADTSACYSIGYNGYVSSSTRGRVAIVNASGASALTLTQKMNDPENRPLINGTAILKPTSATYSTHVAVYYVGEIRDSAHKVNDTTIRAVTFQISDGVQSNVQVARNVGLLSDPWESDGCVYFMGSECVTHKGGSTYVNADMNFAGSNFIFRDSFKDTPQGKSFRRDRCVPVAKTAAGDMACNPYINWFSLNNDMPTVASHVSELAANMHYGCSAVVTGTHPDEKLIGNNQWGKMLTTNHATFAPAIVTVQHKPYRALPSVEHNNSLLIGGGYLKSYDGVACHENGFFRRPAISTIAGGCGDYNGITGRIENGTYQYIATYEFVDAAGNLHRSAPSDPLTQAFSCAGGNGSALITVYNCNMSMRYYENVRVVLYRTTKDQSSYYRIGDVTNNWEDDVVSFYDTFSDDDIFPTDQPEAAHEALYTSFGEKAAGSLGSITDIAIHKNRVMLATTDERVHAAKPSARFYATEVFSESEFQFGEVESGTEKIHGIETTGQALVVFTDQNIYAISGEGPDAAGGTARFTDPMLLRAGRAALEGTIHVTTPLGIVYQTDRGFHLVTAELQSEYIGAPVEDLSIYRGLAAAVDDAKHELYIPLGFRHEEGHGELDAAGYEVVLVFNYFFKAWSQYTYDKSYVGYNSPALVKYKNRMHFGRMRYAYYTGRELDYNADSSVNSGIWRQHEDKFWDVKYGSDADIYSKYSTVVETPYIYTNKLQGAQRIYKAQFLGEYKGDHDITVEMTVDYDTSTAHSQTKTASMLSDKNVYQLPVKRQKNRALKIKHTVTPNASSTIANEMFRLDGLALEVGFRPTTFAVSKGDKI